jgi:SAM-dependent methyltransferase
LGRRGGPAHHLGAGVETRIVRCGSCHGVYQQPTAVPVGNPYLEHEPESYFQHHDSTGKVASGEHLARAAERLLGSRGRMLELGCGRGELLRGAANAGWEVAGVDMTAPYAAIARARFSVDVEVAPVESARALDQEWDVILLAAILEHVYEPTRLLRRVAAALRDGGAVFIDVPNECSLFTCVGNLYQRLRRRDWAVNLSPTFPPFHVVGFCPLSLRHALSIAGLTGVSMAQYRMRSSFSPAGHGFWAHCEKLGVEGALSLGQCVGMGAGLACWARRFRQVPS